MCQNDLFCARQKYIYALICNKKIRALEVSGTTFNSCYKLTVTIGKNNVECLSANGV